MAAARGARATSRYAIHTSPLVPQRTLSAHAAFTRGCWSSWHSFLTPLQTARICRQFASEALEGSATIRRGRRRGGSRWVGEKMQQDTGPKSALRQLDSDAPGLRRLGLDSEVLQDVVRVGSSRGPVDARQELVRLGALEGDAGQDVCARTLQSLWEEIHNYDRALEAFECTHAKWRIEHAAWAAEVDQRQKARAMAASESSPEFVVEKPCSDRPVPEKECVVNDVEMSAEPEEPQRPTLASHGCYIWGSVGSGKSLMMDLFVECFGNTGNRKLNKFGGVLRVHFHAFMLHVQQELHRLRSVGAPKTTRDVAHRIASEVQLLAFDEFQITNIADALIVETLFDALLSEGVVVVMTSNRPPKDLYKDGLNWHLAIPQFLALLERRKVCFHHLSATQDFRLRGGSHDIGADQMFTYSNGPWRDFFHCPDGDADGRDSSAALLKKLIGGASSTRVTREVPIAWGRTLTVEVANESPGVGHFTFSQLCRNPLNADDYLQLAEHFHTMVVDGVPRFSLEQHNEARRFTNLIDCLYERHARLIVSAEAPPGQILEAMEILAGLDLKASEAGSQPMEARSGGGSAASGMLGVGASAFIRGNLRPPPSKRLSPLSQEAEDLSNAARASVASEASGRAGEDDSTTGANVAGVMAGALGSLQESGFAARRAKSRLLHMQTAEYYRVHKCERLDKCIPQL